MQEPSDHHEGQLMLCCPVWQDELARCMAQEPSEHHQSEGLAVRPLWQSMLTLRLHMLLHVCGQEGG